MLIIIILSYIGSKESSISQVNVTPCPAEPCQLKKGVNESIEVIFKPGKNNIDFCFLPHGTHGMTLVMLWGLGFGGEIQ